MVSEKMQTVSLPLSQVAKALGLALAEAKQVETAMGTADDQASKKLLVLRKGNAVERVLDLNALVSGDDKEVILNQEGLIPRMRDDEESAVVVYCMELKGTVNWRSQSQSEYSAEKQEITRLAPSGRKSPIITLMNKAFGKASKMRFDIHFRTASIERIHKYRTEKEAISTFRAWLVPRKPGPALQEHIQKALAKKGKSHRI